MARILVVEDDFDLLQLYKAALSRPGHQVILAAKTAEALAYLAQDAFDLVILDMNMPDIPGIRVIEHVQADPRLRDLPIVVISANPHYLPSVRALGVEHFLVKPVPMRELLSLIGALLVP